MNYYDSKELQNAVYAFCVQSIQQQLNFGLNHEVCYCLGDGRNFAFLNKLNNEHRFFKRIIPLSHPRFIMQYRRKHIQKYIARYLDELK